MKVPLIGSVLKCLSDGLANTEHVLLDLIFLSLIINLQYLIIENNQQADTIIELFYSEIFICFLKRFRNAILFNFTFCIQRNVFVFYSIIQRSGHFRLFQIRYTYSP